MKKFALILALILLLTGCAAQEPAAEAAPEDTAPVVEDQPAVEEAPVEEAPEEAPMEEEPAEEEPEDVVPEDPEDVEPPVLTAAQIADGTYEIEVHSNASMFRVVECWLTVSGDQMTAAMTMSGQGYGMVYMGTGEEALVDTEDTYIPFTMSESGGKVFTVPVEALNVEHDCAAWSIRKEKWYDRILIFESELLPAEAILSGDAAPALADGSYTVEATLSGGTGRATVESPMTVTVENGQMTATVVWSSPFYEFMVLDGVTYDPIQDKGNATFTIPVTLDTDLSVSAQTVAMSQPHLIDYTLRLDSATAVEIAQ